MTKRSYCPFRLIRPNKFRGVTGNKIIKGFKCNQSDLENNSLFNRKPVHPTPEQSENTRITRESFGFVFEENAGRENT